MAMAITCPVVVINPDCQADPATLVRTLATVPIPPVPPGERLASSWSNPEHRQSLPGLPIGLPELPRFPRHSESRQPIPSGESA